MKDVPAIARYPDCRHLYSGTKTGAVLPVDITLSDGLMGVFGNLPYGITPQNPASRCMINHATPATFALASRYKAAVMVPMCGTEARVSTSKIASDFEIAQCVKTKNQIIIGRSRFTAR